MIVNTTPQAFPQIIRRPVPEMMRQDLVNGYFQQQASYWNDIYDREGLEATLYRERKGRVLSLADNLNLPLDAKVLEVGCGAGHTAVELAKRGYRVTAIDAVPEMIRRTRMRAEASGVGPSVETEVADVHRLDFPSNQFSLVLAVGVLPWVDSARDVLREMVRVAKRGGHLILTVDNRWRLNHVLDPRCFPMLRGFRQRVRTVLESVGLIEPRSHVPRHALYSPNQFNATIASVGLAKEFGTSIGFGPFTFMNRNLFCETTSIRIHQRLQRLADRRTALLRFTGVEYIVLALKP